MSSGEVYPIVWHHERSWRGVPIALDALRHALGMDRHHRHGGARPGRACAAPIVAAVSPSCETPTTSPRPGGSSCASKASRAPTRRAGAEPRDHGRRGLRGVLAGPAAREQHGLAGVERRGEEPAEAGDTGGRGELARKLRLGVDHLLHHPGRPGAELRLGERGVGLAASSRMPAGHIADRARAARRPGRSADLRPPSRLRRRRPGGGGRPNGPDRRAAAIARSTRPRTPCAGAGSPGAADAPHLAAWRAAFSAFGAKPSRYPSSAEALAARVLRGDALPRVNRLVDPTTPSACATSCPCGGEDLDRLHGDPAPDRRRRRRAVRRARRRGASRGPARSSGATTSASPAGAGTGARARAPA